MREDKDEENMTRQDTSYSVQERPVWFLRHIAPDFMWCSVFDLFVMYEQLNWEIDFHSFRQLFHQLFRRGEFIRKPDERIRGKGQGRRHLYLRRAAR